MVESTNYAGMQTWPWVAGEYLYVNGVPLVYTIHGDQPTAENVTVHPYTTWRKVVSARATVNGIRRDTEWRLVANTKPMLLSALIAAGCDIQLPKVWRDNNR